MANMLEQFGEGKERETKRSSLASVDDKVEGRKDKISKSLRTARNWAVGVGLAAIIGIVPYSFFVPDKVRTVINDVGIKRYGKTDKYIIFTDEGVFQNTDAWYRFKFRSSDLQNRMIKLKGKEAEITKYGWRFGPLSWYENVVGVQEIKTEKE